MGHKRGYGLGGGKSNKRKVEERRVEEITLVWVIELVFWWLDLLFGEGRRERDQSQGMCVGILVRDGEIQCAIVAWWTASS